MSFLSYPVTAEQKELLQTTGALADLFGERAAQYDWEGRFPLENFTDLHHAGYLTLTMPRELGGRGASMLDLVHSLYRLAQGDASTALVTTMHLTHIGRLVEWRREYPAVVRRICQD